MPWPTSLSTAFQAGDFSEVPADNIIVSSTDKGKPKFRRRFTGKMRTISGTMFLRSNTEYNALMAFYYGEAEEGAAYFILPDQHAGATTYWRFESLEIRSDGGGLGWIATMQLQERPHA
jgi:hypothetical protein